MRQLGLLIAIAFAATPALAEGRRALTPTRSSDASPAPRGSDYSEDFESFALASLDGQNGWSGAPNALVIETSASGFGSRTVRYVSDGSALFSTGISSPTLGSAQLSLSFDVAISALDSQHCVETSDLDTGLLNTRLCFLADGSIEALQVAGPEDDIGFFAPTTGAWSAGVVTRLTIEVDPDGSLRVLQDGASVFQGMDIASVVSGQTNGITAFDSVHENSEPSFFLLDNLEGSVDPPCDGDLNGDGIVGAQDLARILGFWGSSEVEGDLNGDGVVGAQDLARILGFWGVCPE